MEKRTWVSGTGTNFIPRAFSNGAFFVASKGDAVVPITSGDGCSTGHSDEDESGKPQSIPRNRAELLSLSRRNEIGGFTALK